MKKYIQWSGYLYILPAITFLSIFTVFPIIRSVYLSFFNTDSVFSFMEFVGFKHYIDMFSDSNFWLIVKNTLIYGILQVFLATTLGFFLALIANSKKNRFKSLFRVSLFYPYLLPWSVVAMVWMYILHPHRGLLNSILGIRFNWLNNYDLTLYILVLITVWKTVGFNFLFFLSGMPSISKELYEAYSLESKSFWKSVFYITLPMLSPTNFVAVLLSFVGAFQSVDLIYIITQGGPGNSTNTLIYHIYEKGIVDWNVGYGSALSTVLFVGLLLITVIYIKFGEGRVNYEH